MGVWGKQADKQKVAVRWMGDAEGSFIDPKSANICQMECCYPTPKLFLSFYRREKNEVQLVRSETEITTRDQEARLSK